MTSTTSDHEDCNGGAIVWAFACIAVALTIGLPLWLMYFR